MPIELLKKYMPDPDKLKKHKSLQFLGERLHDPNLWHVNRRSVSMAFAVGLFCAWIPSLGQIAMAAIAAFYLRAYLPIAVGLVFLTNPITMPPLFYMAYLFGLWLTGRPSPSDSFQFSIDGVLNGLGDIGMPFLLGCFVIGVACSSAGYFGVHYFWRKSIQHKWLNRQQKRVGIALTKPINYFEPLLPFLSLAKKLIVSGVQRVLNFVPFA